MSIRVLSFMEAEEVTGPARNLIRFGRMASLGATAPGVELTVGTFYRSREDPVDVPCNPFQKAVLEAELSLHVIREAFRFDPRVVGQMKALIQRVNPQIIQTHGIKSHFLIRFLERPRGVRWIGFHHGYTAENAKMLAYNRLNRWSLPAADRVITVCRPFRSDLIREGVSEEKIHVLGNSISSPPESTAEEAVALRTRLGIGEDIPALVSIGRLSKEKGHADLLEAMRLIASERPQLPWALVLAGDGPERQALEAQARQAGIQDKVIFAGYASRTGPFYRIASVFVLPSHSEGSPNVILEAMAAGAPIAATDVGGVSDMVRDGETARLCPPRDPRALANCVQSLLSDRSGAGAFAERALADVKSKFTPESYRDTLVGIYRQVLDLPEPAVPGG